jgi:hypothetical protein
MARSPSYDAMCNPIAAAYAVDEVREIRNKAIALESMPGRHRTQRAERQAPAIGLS